MSALACADVCVFVFAGRPWCQRRKGNITQNIPQEHSFKQDSRLSQTVLINAACVYRVKEDTKATRWASPNIWIICMMSSICSDSKLNSLFLTNSLYLLSVCQGEKGQRGRDGTDGRKVSFTFRNPNNATLTIWLRLLLIYWFAMTSDDTWFFSLGWRWLPWPSRMSGISWIGREL